MPSYTPNNQELLVEVTAIEATKRLRTQSKDFTVQAKGQTSSGAGTATILVQASNLDNPTVDTDWVTLDTLSLTLATTTSSDFGQFSATWRWVRANLTVLTGTGAAVTVALGSAGQ